MCLDAGGAEPASFGEFTAMGAGGFDPAQGLRPPPVVVTGKAEIPQPHQGKRASRVNQKEAPHNYPQMRMVRLRVQSKQLFCGLFLRDS
jgi:hypothetical protein